MSDRVFSSECVQIWADSKAALASALFLIETEKGSNVTDPCNILSEEVSITKRDGTPQLIFSSPQQPGNSYKIPLSTVFGATLLTASTLTSSKALKKVPTPKNSTPVTKSLKEVYDLVKLAANQDVNEATFVLLHTIQPVRRKNPSKSSDTLPFTTRYDQNPLYVGYLISFSQNQLARSFYEFVYPLCTPFKKVLILINPYGGQKTAEKIYSGIPATMLDMAQLQTTVKVSEFAGHVTKLMQELDLNEFDAIATVSGDGLFHEVINGIMSRPDWDKVRHIPLGMIAGGTASAMNKNLDTLFPEWATLRNHRPLDIFSIYQNEKILYSHLNLTWALIADIDIESEKYRWMGAARITVGAVVRIMKLRKYKGSIYYLPIDAMADLPSTDSLKDIPQEHFRTPVGSVPSDIDLQAKSELKKVPEPSSPEQVAQELADVSITDTGCLPCLRPSSYPSHHGPKLFHLMSDYTKWPGKLVDERFTTFNLANLSWIAPDFLASPDSRLSSGFLDFIYSDGDVSGMQLLPYFADATKAQYFQLKKHVHHHHVKALVIIPEGLADSAPTTKTSKNDLCTHPCNDAELKNKNAHNGIFSLSGESIPCVPSRLEIHPKMMNVLAPVHLDEQEWTRLFLEGNPQK